MTGTLNVGSKTLSCDYIGGALPHGARVRRSSGHGGWLGIDTAEVEIPSGLPDMADAIVYDAQEKLVNAYYGVPPSVWMMNPGGGGSGNHVPDEPSLPFDSDVSPAFRISLNAVYTEAPYWADGPFLSISFGAYTSATDTIVDKTFGGDGLMVIYKKKAFRAVATALHDLGGFSTRLWVLCERSPGDDVGAL